jgi:hypothetical protein
MHRWCVARQNPLRKFISFVKAMADDLLRPYGHVVIALSVVLKMRRTLTGL